MKLGPLAVVAFCGLGACAPSPAAGESVAPQADLPREWTYSVTIGGEPPGTIEHADVRLCFVGPAPARLVAKGPTSASALREVRGEVEGGAWGSLPMVGAAIDSSRVGTNGCVEYRVDFSAQVQSAKEAEDWQGAFWIGPKQRTLMTRPALWLWRPERFRRAPRITIELSTPDEVALSIPWTPLPAGGEVDAPPRFALDPTVYRWTNYMMLGQFQREQFEHAGARVDLVKRGFKVSLTDEGWRDWITDAIDGVALLYEGFPRERIQILTLPLLGDYGPVVGGSACRGGGASVFLWFNAEAEDDQIPGHWVTIHELLHLGMPFVEDRWMSEGFVTYYTEVLRTRQGHRSEERGWQGLLWGFQRAIDDDRVVALREASENINELGAHHRVYWSGAALALLLDVALRDDSGGTRTLDDAMRELRRCCGESRVKVSARAMLEHLDDWYGKPLFTQTVLPRLDDLSFPDLGPTFERLGIDPADGEAVFEVDHPGAAMRRAIMTSTPPERVSAR